MGNPRGNTRVGIFVQVRLASTRLARKALLEVAGYPMIVHAMRALKGVPAAARSLLTVEDDVSALQPLAEAEGFAVFCGPEDDVLSRFTQAAGAMGVDRIVRATGDSPLVSPDLCRRALTAHAATGADLSHFMGMPLGTGVEVVETRALARAARDATAPDEREHITTHLYRRCTEYAIREWYTPRCYTFPGADVSVDSPEDYERIQAVFDDLYRGDPVELQDVVGWLRRNPEHVRMREIIY